MAVIHTDEACDKMPKENTPVSIRRYVKVVAKQYSMNLAEEDVLVLYKELKQYFEE